MTPSVRRVGWVESPLQLINALEAAASTDEDTLILLRRGVAQLADTAAWLEPHLPAHVRFDDAAAATDPRFAGATHRLVGDAFSGQVRAVLASRAVGDLVVVDDGSAALHLAAVLAGTQGFSRMGQREPLHQRALGRVSGRRLRDAARAGRVTLMTAYADHPAMPAVPGARMVPNRYSWLRTLAVAAPATLPPTVVLGSALAVDGYIDDDAYGRWVLAHGAGAAYLPHRRETPAWLDVVRAAGLDVVDSGLPAEIVLGADAGVRTVTSLPSSTGATLARVLRDHATLTVTPIPDAWWTGRADGPLRSTLAALTITDPAPTEEA
ncbi:hypothetical protein QQX09_04690 [Demequina sp. SYSU T00192]|uniref:Uncharacterized protein n=1 Tax=Demequina litoralis TaxID=3051660 RepID=A0ABT8G7M7_9MICO|nr:hypothetical protein [Demequina sp. SYSU T00192]MDN4475155.1 hypothetical protein [Demequina sp. SYSU T00192]